LNYNKRVIAKHKALDFQETKTEKKVTENIQVLTDAAQIANEWVTHRRLEYVLQKIIAQRQDEALLQQQEPEPLTIKVIHGMILDVYREAAGEIVESKAVEKAISKVTLDLFRDVLNYNSILKI
jgi:hypothetical protein